MRLSQLLELRDPEKLARRLVLYSKRLRPRIPWRPDGGFDTIWGDVRRRTLLPEVSAQTLFQLARHAAGFDASLAEVGVFRGGTAKLLAHVADRAGRKLHLFDTFEGMPEADPTRDLHTRGDFSETSLASVQAFLAGHPSAALHQGFFPESAAPVAGERFSFVHVDVDIAPSVEACCTFFYPRMVPGGVLVFDDYGHSSCPGAKLAVDDFFRDKPEPVLHWVTGQGIVIIR